MPFIGNLLLDVLRDGNDNWYDVSTNPTDLISFPKITDWNTVSQAHRAERELIVSEITKFELSVASMTLQQGDMVR